MTSLHTVTAPVFFTPVEMNKVEVVLHSNDGEEETMTKTKKLLVRRSVSDRITSKYIIAQRQLALKSLSESCLFVKSESSSSEDEMTEDVVPALIASNVDGEEDEEDKDFCCNCGCGVPIGGIVVTESNVESEDEGCYFLPGSQFDSLRHAKGLSQGNKAQSSLITQTQDNKKMTETELLATQSEANKPSNAKNEILINTNSVLVEDSSSKEERRSFSLSVDSGRSSHAGTLGYHSSGSSKCSSSSSTASDEECVKIVSHSFCDFTEKSVEEQQEESLTNKVSVFVPYSAITDIKRRESSKNSFRNHVKVSNHTGGNSNVTDVFSDNVVICDTQVILRINSQPAVEEAVVKDSESSKQSKLRKKRMARRMTTTVAVYEMVNKDSDMKKVKEEDEEIEQVETKPSVASSVKPKPPRRKDLCKLLGLIEYDVTTDATNPEDIKLAQKVALDNLISAIQESKIKSAKKDENDDEKIPAETQNENALSPIVDRKATKSGGGKKNLAKFLGVEEVDFNQSVDGGSTNGTKSKKSDEAQNRSFPSLGQLMKMSMKWTPSNGNYNIGKGKGEGKSGKKVDEDIDDLLDVYQLKRANEVIFGTSCSRQSSRRNRKDLNKFLGLDDSDSEEMVFIQNRKNKTNAYSGSTLNSNNPNDNSLNRSEQNSSSVSVVGIRIESADGEEIDEEEIASSYSSSPCSTIDRRQLKLSRRKSSLNNFLRGSNSNHKSRQNPPFRSLSAARRSKVNRDKNSSLGSKGQKTTEDDEDEDDNGIQMAKRDNDDEDEEFLPPQRKSVLFKEYDFSVEESIAQGLPIIPNSHNGSLNSEYLVKGKNSQQNSLSSSSVHLQRKKKKDAAKRSAEIRAHHHMHYNQRQRGEAIFTPPPPPQQPYSDSEELKESIKEKKSRSRKKVQRGAMVRKHRMLIPDQGGDPIYLDVLRSQPHHFVPVLPQQQHQHHFGYQPQVFFPVQHQMVSYCNKNGRIRMVPWRPRPDYLDETFQN